MRDINPQPRIQYIRDLFAVEDNLLEDINQRLIDTDFPIQIGSEEGRLLQILIHMIDAKQIVELGTLAGYSTIWMARALKEKQQDNIKNNNNDSQIYTIENTTKRANMAQDFFAQSDVANYITLLRGHGVDELTKLSQQSPFDMIFIDADKINYCNYLDWADDNIRSGGLIVADNSFLFDSVYKDEPQDGISPTTLKTMQSFNNRIADNSKYYSIMIPTKEGLTIAIKR